MNYKSKLFISTAVSFLISSITVFFVSSFPRDKNLTAANTLACVFWLFFIAGIILTVVISKKTSDKKQRGHSIRVFRFFRNKGTKVTDTILFISLITVAVMGTLHIQSDILQEIAIFLFLYSSELHCVFNLLD